MSATSRTSAPRASKPRYDGVGGGADSASSWKAGWENVISLLTAQDLITGFCQAMTTLITRVTTSRRKPPQVISRMPSQRFQPEAGSHFQGGRTEFVTTGWRD